MEENEALPRDSGETASDLVPRQSYKSFRRKYRKLMVNFEERMRESSTLFREHQRITDISRRLSKQNDQLLELLYDLNNAPNVSPAHRYDLSPAVANSTVPENTEIDAFAFDPQEQVAAVPKQRPNDTLDLLSTGLDREAHKWLRRGSLIPPQRSYASLLALPYTPLDTHESPDDALEINSTGYLAPHEEDEYLESLDSYLNGTAPAPFAAKSAQSAERNAEREREMALKNPVSVYNWLRKHQPQVFLQDSESHPEKQSTRTASSRTSKRAGTVKIEGEMYDEDGIAIDPGPNVKTKRKRDDDGGYRPKGGSGRSAKRKKEDGSTSAKKSKKADRRD